MKEGIKVNLSFIISHNSFELLKRIDEAKYAEFRDINYPSLKEFKKSKEFKEGFRTEQSFKNRNFCDYQDTEELREFGLIDGGDDMSWHPTYYVSEFGKKILKDNKL